MDKLDCVIVGAGVVGLAVARSLALAGREVIVLEAEPQIGVHSSSRNSEVVHAGIYYPENSLKARLCVQGKEMLYRYCEAHHVAHQRIGKLIIASGRDDVDKLQVIEQQARLNGVDDLQFLDTNEVSDLEPVVVSHGALLSPSTGIVDTHEFMTAMEAEKMEQLRAMAQAAGLTPIAVLPLSLAVCSSLMRGAHCRGVDPPLQAA